MSKLLFAAIFSFLVASEAFAQLVDGGRLPIAIERVSQAAGMCRSDDIQAESGVRGGSLRVPRWIALVGSILLMLRRYWGIRVLCWST